eukprot:352824-Chlamydomonas_euryale.AAC.3
MTAACKRRTHACTHAHTHTRTCSPIYSAICRCGQRPHRPVALQRMPSGREHAFKRAQTTHHHAAHLRR